MHSCSFVFWKYVFATHNAFRAMKSRNLSLLSLVLLCMVRMWDARHGHAHGGLCGARERVSMHVRDLACRCHTPRSRGGSRSRLAGGRRRCTKARSSWDATHRPHSREGSTRHGNRAQRAASGRPLPRGSAVSGTFAKLRQLGACYRVWKNPDKSQTNDLHASPGYGISIHTHTRYARSAGSYSTPLCRYCYLGIRETADRAERPLERATRTATPGR